MAAQTNASDLTAQQVADLRAANNADYLASVCNRWAVCSPSGGGNALNQAYASNTVLYYDMPLVDDGWLQSLQFDLDLNLDFAIGAGGANYALTAAGPFGLFDSFEILVAGISISKIRPYMCELIAIQRGYNRPLNSVVNNTSNSTIANQLKTLAVTANSTNEWKFTFRLPLRNLHDHMMAGMLPISAQFSKVQLKVTTTASIYGVDPMTNAVCSGGTGTGQAVTLHNGGPNSLKVTAIYRDGVSTTQTSKKQLQWQGESTLLWNIDQPITSLVAGTSTPNKGRLTTALQHSMVDAIVIDGNQSTTFSTISNILGISLDTDQTGKNYFYRFGTNTQQTMYDWYEEVRLIYGQDFPIGVVPWINAMVVGADDPDSRMGRTFLDMTAKQWTNVYHTYFLNSVGGVGGITPRIELYELSIDPTGIQLA